MNFRENYRSPIGKLRVVGFLEGISFVLLVAFAMPFKYWLGMPIFVSVVGSAHGFLFVWLCVEIAQAVFGKDWPLRRGAIVFFAALFPLGPFFIDGWLKKEQEAFDVASPS